MSAPERFFYHSFPRQPRDDAAARLAKALTILQMICEHGLLLVPEKVTWRDPFGDRAGDLMAAMQRRISFTELSPPELPAHSVQFGPVSIEFAIPDLRALGALPIFYVPDGDTASGLAATGTALLGRIADTLQMLTQLGISERVLKPTWSNRTPRLTLEVKDRDGKPLETVAFDSAQSNAIAAYLFALQKAPGANFQEMENALRAMSSIFYPTENLTYTDEPAYYRQREWRIISGLFVEGRPTSEYANQAQVEKLMALDPRFFGKELDFEQGMASIGTKCHFLREVRGRHVATYIRRVIAPTAAKGAVERILEDAELKPQVATLESLAA